MVEAFTIKFEGWVFESASRWDILPTNLRNFDKKIVRETVMNALPWAQLTFQMSTLQTNIFSGIKKNEG